MCMYKNINIFREPENLRLTAIAAHAHFYKHSEQEKC
jgi:hypothetical protein